jgi:hypothetical protein
MSEERYQKDARENDVREMMAKGNNAYQKHSVRKRECQRRYAGRKEGRKEGR